MKPQKIIPAVLGLPVRKNSRGESEFLLTQRHAPHHPQFHLKWQLAGGAIEFGETPEQALEREFQEELSVTPTIIHSEAIVLTNTWVGGDDSTHRDVQLILLCYIVSIQSQQPVITDPDEETAAFKWYTYAEVLHLGCLPNTQNYIKRAKEIISQISH